VDLVVKSPVLAVIPARGGSKRLPRKNVLDFGDKPMLAWTIEAALHSDVFDRVLVSTDDEEIAAVARAHGAEAPFLRQEANDDHAPSSAATLAALGQAEAHWQTSFASIVQLMPNCPLREARHIRAMAQHFETRQTDFLLSAFRYGWMNPWWAHQTNEKGKPAPLFAEALTQRSQDLPPLLCPTGAIWMADVAALKKSASFYGPGFEFFLIEWFAAVDIDDQEDFDMAQAIFQMNKQRRHA
jgi:CMP-N-acetylneuraminic acid synthetase